MTQARTFGQVDAMYSALAGLTWNGRPGSVPYTSTGPLLYQSNSGPTVSSVVATKPSSETTADAMTFPMTTAPSLLDR